MQIHVRRFLSQIECHNHISTEDQLIQLYDQLNVVVTWLKVRGKANLLPRTGSIVWFGGRRHRGSNIGVSLCRLARLRVCR